MDKIQETSEVKETDIQEEKSVEAVTDNTSENVKEVANSQPHEENKDQDKKVAEVNTSQALSELEEVLKTLEPSEVVKFQREISSEMGENLFKGEIGELFSKYKPKLSREEQVKNIAGLLRGEKKPIDTAKPTIEDNSLKEELLTAKVKLELVRQGVSDDYLDDATTVALSKIKDASELSKCHDIAVRYSTLKKSQDQNVSIPSSIRVGDKEQDMTEGEKAVAFLKKLNPKGFK